MTDLPEEAVEAGFRRWKTSAWFHEKLRFRSALIAAAPAIRKQEYERSVKELIGSDHVVEELENLIRKQERERVLEEVRSALLDPPVLAMLGSFRGPDLVQGCIEGALASLNSSEQEGDRG